MSKPSESEKSGEALRIAVNALNAIADAPKGSLAHELRDKANRALAAIAVEATK